MREASNSDGCTAEALEALATATGVGPAGRLAACNATPLLWPLLLTAATQVRTAPANIIY